jgi:hypothetical protein
VERLWATVNVGMEGCRTANPWGFLSKPSFKITAKGKRHRNEPMACDFEEIVRPTPAEPQSTQALDGRRLSVDHGEHRPIIPPGRMMMQMIGGGSHRRSTQEARHRQTARDRALCDISQPTMSRIVALHRMGSHKITMIRKSGQE